MDEDGPVRAVCIDALPSDSGDGGVFDGGETVGGRDESVQSPGLSVWGVEEVLRGGHVACVGGGGREDRVGGVGGVERPLAVVGAVLPHEEAIVLEHESSGDGVVLAGQEQLGGVFDLG